MGEGEVKIVGLPSRERGRLETVELPLMGRGKKNHLVCRRQWCCSAWGAKVRIFLLRGGDKSISPLRGEIK
jgi:hypothetical protein